MQQYLEEIQSYLAHHANPAAKAAHEKFVPGAKKVYGVRTPVLNELAGKYKEGGIELVKALWKSGALEEKMLAAKMLGKIARKNPEATLKLVAIFSKQISDWAVCDTLGMQSVKPLVKTHQHDIFSLAASINRSPDPWQRRLSLVLVEWYTRDKSAHAAIRKLVNTVKDDREYYVKKAVEWIERNMTKGK